MANTLYVGSGQTYQTINDAVAAASATDATTIILAAGTYAEDITLDARSMEQKGNLKFIAAEGAEVTFTGLFTIGYYEKRVGSKKWDADVTFENIIFDQAADAKHSIDIQQVNDFTMTNCKVIGDGEYGIGGTNVDNGATITGTTFENAAIQSAGNFGTNLLLEDCIFDESRVNIQSGNSVTIKDCTFDCTVTDANVRDSFYCVRSNDNAIAIENTKFNIDSALTEVASEQEKWGVLWQRNVGGTKWSVSDIEVNFSDAAMEQSELLFNKNGTTTEANEAGRITIKGMSSADNDIADLFAKSEGTLKALIDTDDGLRYNVYDDGVLQSSTGADTIYVSDKFTANSVPADLLLGFNAFADVNEAEAVAEAGAAKMVIAEGADVTYTKDQYYFLNTNPNEGGENNAFDNVVDAEKTYDMEINGTFRAYQILLNNANTTIGTTGKAYATSEAFRVMGGSLTVQGSRAEDAGVPGEIFTGSWGGGVKPGADAQISAGYFMVNQEAKVAYNDTVIFVAAGIFNVDNAEADFDNAYIYLGSVGTYLDVQLNFTNGADVTFGNNTTVINDAAFGMHMTVDSASSVTVADSEVLTLDTVKNSGSIVLTGDATLEASDLANGCAITITGLTAGAERTVKLSMTPDGEDNGVVIDVAVAADATTATVYVSQFADGSYNAMVIDGTSVKQLGSIAVKTGSIAMDATSTIIADTYAGSKAITVTVDLENFSGVNKIIDLTSPAAGLTLNYVDAAGKALTVEELAAAGINVFTQADGDVLLANVDMTTLFVDGNFKGEFGEKIAEGKYFGLNAFNSFAEALKNIAAETGEISLAGDITEAGPAANTTISLTENLTISGGNVTWTSASGWVYFAKDANAEGDVTLTFDGFTLDATEAKKAFFIDVDTVIDGNSAVSLYNAKVSSNSTVTVEAGSQFNVYKEELQIDGGSKVVINGSEDFTAAGAELADRQMFLQYSRNVKGDIEINDSYVASYQGFYIRDNGSITADNSLIQLGTGADGVWHYNPVSNGYGELRLNSATAELNLTNGSVLEISGNVINSGTINVDGSSFIANGALVSDGVIKDAQNTGVVTNDGTIKVSGESTLNIRELAGNTVTFAAGTTLTDSYINYTGSNAFGLDGVTCKGDNTINAASYSTSGAKITVAAGASLTATGGRWAFGSNALWNINGSIENVKALTNDEKAALTASLSVNGLSLSTGGGEAVMNVTDAYFTFGSGHVTTKNTNATGGKIVMNFTNSVVKSAYKYAVNPTKAGYDSANAPEVVLNVKDSVFELNNYFTNNHAKGTVTIDNTDFTATAFGNTGTVNISNGSEVNFSLVNNGLNDWAGKGSLNAGTITVDASDLTIANAGATLEFYNVGAISLSNGAKFTLDKLVNAEANDLTGGGNINTTFADMVGNITIDNTSQLTVNTLFTNNGTITIDALSTLTADSIANNGTITIDATGFTGTRVKVIDLNQEAALSGVKLKGTGYYLEYAADGDVSIVKSPDTVYVSSDYNSSTEGWGYTHFANYDSAVAYIKDNAKKATMIIEKTTTVSGNCFADKSESLGVDLTNAVIVKDGAVVGNAQSKWDMTYSVTLEGGAILQSARPVTAGIGNTHIKNVLTIGDGSEKRAEVRFINGLNGITYQTMSIALLGALNRKLVTNNALVEVGDLGINGTASFTDTTFTIAGIFAIKGTGLYKTTMTDSTMTVKGHNLMNENTYYSTEGTILSTLTMDNSSITVDDGAEDTAAEKVWLGYTGNVARTLTLTNGSSITVEKGTEVEVANTVTAADSTITVGTLNAGTTKYGGDNSFNFNGLEKGKVYWAVLYDADGNELETIERTSLNYSTFSPKFSAQPAGDYKAVCYKDEAKTEIHQEKTYSFTAVGTLTLTNSDIVAETITLAGGNLTMDYKSSVTFTGIEGGYITVSDAASYVDNADVADGTYKLLDYTGDAAMTEAGYKVLLNDAWHDNYMIFNNDLYLTDQDTSLLRVSAEWKDAEQGSINPDGSIIGFNAFAKVESIADKIKTDGGDTTVKFESNIEVTGTVDFIHGAGDIIFTADEAVTIAQTVAGKDFSFVQSEDMSVIVDKNVTFEIYDNASGWYQYYGPSLELYGTITGGQNWGCTYLFNGEHTVHSTGTLSTGRVQLGFTTLNVEGDAESERTAAHIDTNYLLVEGSTFNAENAIVEAGIIHDSNNGGMRWGASEFYFNGSKLTGNMTIQYAESIVEFNDSDITIGTLTNAGSVTVDGASTLNITKVEGNAINVIGGTLSGSTIGSGFVAFTGDAALEGENTLGGVNKVLNGSTLTIDEDADVTAHYLMAGEDNYFAFGNDEENKGGTIDINGKLTITQNLNANANGIVNINEGAEVKAAIVAVENGKITAEGTQSGVLNVDGKLQSTFLNVFSGGTANINEGGYVQLGGHETDQQLLQLGADSAVNVSGELKIVGSGTVDGTLTVDGGNFTATKTLTNNGTITVSGESTVNIGTLSGNALGVINGTLVGDSNIGGNIHTRNFALAGTLTVKQTNMYETAVVKNGAVFNGATTIVGATGEFTLENGGTINSRFFNVVGGKAEINGAINLLHSDPRQKLLQLHEGGVANINTGAVVTIDGHNAIVKDGGTLNIVGGTLDITTWDQYKDDPARGGVLYNDGVVTMNGGVFNGKTIDNTNGSFTVSGESTVVVGSVSGNGIVLDDATLTADSNIGSGSATKVYGNSTIKGTVGNVHANWAGVKENDSCTGYTTDDVALTLDGATTGNVYVGSDTEGYAAALTVKGGSTVGGIYNRVYGSTVITGSDNVISYINAKGSVSVENAENTEITAMVAEGAEITVTDSEVKFAIGTSNCIQLDEGTTMTISGSEVDIQQMTIDAASALKLTNSTVTVDDVYDEVNLITNNGSITIDALSTLTADTIENNGTITIDAANFEGGIVKLIDVTSTFGGEINLINSAENVSIFRGSDGDVLITDATSDALFVNAAWAGSEIGAPVDGYVFGFNAFADVASALQSATASTESIKVVEGTSAEFYTFAYNKIESFNENGLLIDMGQNGVSFDKSGATTVNGQIAADDDTTPSSAILGGVTIGEKVKVIADQLAVDPFKVARVEGELDINGAYLFGGQVEVAGSVNVNDNFIMQGGYGSTTKLTVEAGAEFNAVNIYGLGSATEAVINGTASVKVIETAGSVSIGENGVLNLAEGKSDIAALTNSGEMNISSGAEVAAGDVFVDNAAVINVENAALDVTTVTALSDINVTDSTFTAEKLALNGCYIITGFQIQDEDREVTLVFFEKGSSVGGRSFTETVKAGEDFARFINDTIRDGEYDVTVVDGNDSIMVNFNADDGDFNVYGNSSVSVKELTGKITINENAKLSASKVESGTVAVIGNAEMAGDGNDLRNLYIAGTNADGSAATVVVGADSTLKSTIVSVGGTEGKSDFDKVGYFDGYYNNVAGAMDIAGTLNTEALALYKDGKMTVSGTVKAPEFYLRDASAVAEVKAGGTVTSVYTDVAGTMNLAGTLNVKGFNGEHTQANVLGIGGKLSVNGGTINSNRGITVYEGGELDIANGSLIFSDLNGNDSTYNGKLTANGSVNVTGNSVVKIDTLAGTINVDDADLTGYVSGGTLNVTGESTIGAGFMANNFAFGTLTETVDANIDLTGLAKADFAVQNGTVDITGKMDASGFGLAQFRVSGNYNTANGLIQEGDLNAGSSIVNIGSATDTDVYVKAHQVYISETGAVNKHTLNVYGELEATNSIFNKYNGEFNVYGKAAANYLQVAGNVTVTGEGAQLNLAGVGSNGVAKVGIADGSSKFTISNGATLDADGVVLVGYNSDRNGEMIVDNATVDASAGITVAADSTFTIKGTSTVKAAVTGNISLNGDVAFSDDTAITITGDVTADGDVEMKYNAITGATNFTVEGTLSLRDVVLPAAGESITLVEGKGSFGGLSINGDKVVDNALFFVNGNNVDLYNVTYGADKVTLDSVAYTPMSGEITSVAQQKGTYSFTVTPEIAGGFGGYTYTTSAYDVDGKEIATAAGLTVIIPKAELESLSNSKLTFKVTATDKPGKTYTTGEVEAVLRDYHDARRDFNASGVSDIAVFDEASRTFSVIADQTDGSFSKYQIDAPVTDTSWKCLGTGYMNSGKTQDVLWVHDTGEVGVWLVDGAEKTHQTVAGATSDWKFLAIADVTGDGRDNIIWQHEPTGTVLAWESGADAVHSGDKVLGGVNTAEWNFAGTGDVTGDGAHDILWRHTSGLAGFWNSSDKSWVSLGSADEHWQILETGDFDKDGVDEVLWQNESGLIGAWDYDHSSGSVTWNSFGDANTLAGYDFSAVGDYNGDGFEDILWCDGNDNYKVWSIENNEKKESVDIKLA